MNAPARFAPAPFSPAIEVRDLYLLHYQPAKHPGDLHRTTRQTYLIELKKLNDFFQFRSWLVLFNSPPREELSTRELYADFQWWLEHCGSPPPNVRLSDMTDELLVGAMNWLVERGRRRPTANKLRATVNCVWKWGAKKLGLKRPDNERYRCDLPEPIAFLPDELTRILATAAGQRGLVGKVPAGQWWLACVLFIFSGGTRISAARHVATRKLDLVRGGMCVLADSQKQRREQWLDLHKSTIEALLALRLEERGIETVLGDWPYNTNTLRRHFARILVEAGIFASVDQVPRELKFHALRKTLGSQIFEKAGIHAACDRLGHSSAAVTERYIDPRYRSKPRIGELVKDPLSTPPDTRPPLSVYRDEAC